MKVIEELEREDADWKLKTNRLTIEKNKAVDEANSLKAQGAIFKKEYTSMEDKLSAATKEITEKDVTLSSLQVSLYKINCYLFYFRSKSINLIKKCSE